VTCGALFKPEDAGSVPVAHFVDLFGLSAALHWDGHSTDDPVHFFGFPAFYEQSAGILLAALQSHCGADDVAERSNSPPVPPVPPVPPAK
jgi:hypothetical protein